MYMKSNCKKLEKLSQNLWVNMIMPRCTKSITTIPASYKNFGNLAKTCGPNRLTLDAKKQTTIPAC